MGSGQPSGRRDGGVDAEPAFDSGRESYRRAEEGLSQLKVPVFLQESGSHERLYVAAMDGTGNSMFDDDPEQWSVVAKIYEQIEEQKHARISSGYVEGTYTQNGLLKTPEKWWDGRFGHTFDERVETAYLQFCEQAKKWLDEDPHAQIRLAGVGFSRGAEGIAALERVVHERGIRDPQGAKIERDAEGLVVRVEYADRPLLVEPGKTPQVALLFDPVSTGVEEHDRRLPPSTLTTFQITAQHERRDLFPSSEHVPAGFSEDHRNYNAWVAGAHSDIGDTYLRNGLGTESFNLGVEFLNRLSDRPYLEKRALPDDPDQYVIHRSDQHMAGLYGTKGFDRDGVRDHETQLAPDRSCRRGVVDDCNRKEPIDEALDAQVERRIGTSARQAGRPDSAMEQAARPGLNEIVEKVARDGMGNGAGLMPAVVAEYLRGPWAREFQAEIAKELAARDAASRPLPVETVRESTEVVR